MNRGGRRIQTGMGLRETEGSRMGEDQPEPGMYGNDIRKLVTLLLIKK